MGQIYNRNWDGLAWQRRCHLLVQLRHGASNVQSVPDRVNGDAGLEFFTFDGCLYQCYAPETPEDTAKSSSAMKQKATRDLPKLKKNEAILTKLLAGLKFKRWILLCPFLDDKAVVTHVRAKGAELCKEAIDFLDPNFEALVQCQEDFAAEIAKIKQLPIGAELIVEDPTSEEIGSKVNTPLADVLESKLGRAFPNSTISRRALLKRNYIKNHIKRENILDTLKMEHPILWERAWQTINAEQNRLEILGAGQLAPAKRLEDSLQRIEQGLTKDLPTLSHAALLDLSTGTLSDWLMRCPLDFDGEA